MIALDATLEEMKAEIERLRSLPADAPKIKEHWVRVAYVASAHVARSIAAAMDVELSPEDIHDLAVQGVSALANRTTEPKEKK